MAQEWAGDRAAQRRGTKRILRAIEGMHPVDAMAALGTIVANTVSDYSHSRADAERAFLSLFRVLWRDHQQREGGR